MISLDILLLFDLFRGPMLPPSAVPNLPIESSAVGGGQVLFHVILSSWTCKTCCYLNVCTIYHKVHGGISEDSGLGLYEANVQHLTAAHAKFSL
ncbi:hypothetical protein LINGRAHAP2_LOCUS13832 [Linum grandiflorum]